MSKQTCRRRASVMFALWIFAPLADQAGAVDFNWNVAGPADWNVGTNWNPEGPPSGGGGDHARINNGGTAVISANIPDIQDIFVGDGAGTSGTLNQTGGTIHGGAGATNGWSFVGQNGGTGTYNLSGGTSDNERLYIGRLGGTGAANISGTGRVEWATTPGGGEFVVGIDAGSMGSAAMSGNGAVNTGLVLFGVGGPADNLAVGNLTMSDDSSITSGGNVELQNGTYTVTDNASISAGNEVWVGQAAGRSATLNQDSGVIEADTWFAIGRESATGVVNLSGTATIRKINTGSDNSDGSFIVIGGLGTGGSGTLNVEDEATVSSDTGMVLNETAGQAGTVNQSGGTVTLHDFTPQMFQPTYGQSLNIDPNGHGQGAYHLSGGQLNAETVLVGGGVFDMTGGVFSATNFIGNLAQNGGSTSPGSSPGTMTVTGNYSLNSGDLLMELDGLTPGTGHDQLIVTGDVSLAGALTLSLGFTPSFGDMFEIIDNQGANPVSGMFTQGSSISAGGFTFGINYAAGDGNDVVLTVVPEPAGLALMGATAAMGLVALRRRYGHPTAARHS